MTERQWLECNDPREMLTWLMGHDATTAMRRRLKPVVEACRLIFNPDGLWLPTESSESLKNAVDFWLRGSTPIEPDVRSAIIRDVIGNPFRFVTIESGWLTPLVLSLARAVDDAASKVCDNCRGKGFWISEYDGTRLDCGLCKGRTGNGTLDPVRLAVLADAMIEAGLPETVRCQECDGKGWVYSPQLMRRGSGWNWCEFCHDGRLPHPLLAHLRAGAPHWRGCHVIEAILKKGGES